jgi:hypothetical protein
LKNRIAALRILVVAVASLICWGCSDALAQIPPITIASANSRIARWISGPDGKPDSFVLDDHTVVNLSGPLAHQILALAPGRTVQVRGVLIASRPNRVIVRPEIRANGQLVLNDATYWSAPITRDLTTQSLQRLDKSSSLLAVSAGFGGEIDRLLLSDGTVIEIPFDAQVDGSKLELGQSVSVEGAGPAFPNRNFIEAMNLFGGPTHVPLLQARRSVGDRWVSKNGTIQQTLLTPQGDITGLLLTDGSAIRFRPIPAHQMSLFYPGMVVRASGASTGGKSDGHLEADLISFPTENKVIDLTPVSPGHEITTEIPSPAGEPSLLQPHPAPFPEQTLTLMRDTAPIKAVLRSPRGKVEMLVLSDGTSVSVPPRLSASISSRLKVGDRVAIAGPGAKYLFGTAMEADQLIKSG